MSQGYLLALDQGTTGTTCLLFDQDLKVVGRAYHEVRCEFPQPGWVSQDPEDLWASCLVAMRGALRHAGIEASQVRALGLTNQRETTILWDRATGRPIHDAVVWQCRRTAGIVQGWVDRGLGARIQERTGLVPDAYFSASKIRWILDQVPGSEERAKRGELAFGTVDSWVLWKLTGGRVHATEPSNAARTMIFDIHTRAWDRELLQEFGIPEGLLPKVLPTTAEFGVLEASLLGAEIPVLGIAGDQQAALFGQCCFEPGDVKNTYGTGCFLVMNTGDRPFPSHNRLLSTIAWDLDGQVDYALEGSVFSAGSAVQWLRDGLGLIRSASETEELARRLDQNGGVYLVPAFSGLGAPYWDPHARAAVVGMTRDTRPEHLVRAALEAAAYQTRDVVEAMVADSGRHVGSLRVDGGMVANNFLMQFQSDLLGVPVQRPVMPESTALGAAALAGLKAGFFDRKRLAELHLVDRTFQPGLPAEERDALYEGWKDAVTRTLSK